MLPSMASGPKLNPQGQCATWGQCQGPREGRRGALPEGPWHKLDMVAFCAAYVSKDRPLLENFYPRQMRRQRSSRPVARVLPASPAFWVNRAQGSAEAQSTLASISAAGSLWGAGELTGSPRATEGSHLSEQLRRSRVLFSQHCCDQLDQRFLKMTTARCARAHAKSRPGHQPQAVPSPSCLACSPSHSSGFCPQERAPPPLSTRPPGPRARFLKCSAAQGSAVPKLCLPQIHGSPY